MTEIRGTVIDRAWGLTLSAIAQRQHTGQLAIDSDGKRYAIAFEGGAIVGAASPLAADSIARIALTNHFITSTQVPEITRRLAAAADRDEVDALSDVVRFSPDQAFKLRYRLLAQRAARTFSLERGDFVLDGRIALPVVAGVALDYRHVIYLGARSHLSEQRLIDDLRDLGAHFALKPEALEDLPRFGFESSAQPVIEALKRGTSLPELEATHRELDPRFAQAIIYALTSCGSCITTSRTATPPVVARAATPVPAATEPAARTSTRPMKPTALRNRETSDPDARAPGERTPPPPTAPPAVAQGTRSGLSPMPGSPPAGPAPAALGTGAQPALATGTNTFTNTPATGVPTTSTRNTPPSSPPLSAGRTTTSPFAARTQTTSSSAYSGGSSPDSGTNTPAAVRGRTQPEPPRTQTRSGPAPSRTSTPGPRPRTQTPPPGARTLTANPLAARPAQPPARASTPNITAAAPADAPATARSDTEETLRFPDTPTPLPNAAKQSQVTFGEPQPTRAASPTSPPIRPSTPALSLNDGDTIRGFNEQLTPGFGEQTTPSDQRTPGSRASDQRTPTERTPSDPRASAAPTTSRVSTDNAAAADAAFKRGELAMKRDQPGEAILEFKAACDLNPNDVDYAGMLAWAKFCAAGDKPGIGADTRKVLERAVFKSQRPERARFYLGRVERMLGRDKEALRHFQEVLDIKPNHAEAASEVRAIEARLATNKGGGGGLFGRKR